MILAALRVALVLALILGVSAGANAGGALAIGACAAYGHAYDFAKLDDARKAAISKCSGPCQIVATMRRSCAAFAIDGHNPCGAHGYAVAPDLAKAQNDALRSCFRYGGRDCVIRAFACDAKG